MSSSNIKVVKFVQFGIPSDQYIRLTSVCQITKPTSKGGIIRDNTNTPYDERMGVLEEGKACLSCGKNVHECPGHNGYIVLPEPIYNRVYINKVYKILQCICYKCSRPRILPSHAEVIGLLKLKRNKRLKLFFDKCSKITYCPWEDCRNSPLRQYCIKEELIYSYFSSKKNDPNKFVEVTAGEAWNLLSRISNEHINLLGFNDNLSPNKIYTSEDILLNENMYHAHQNRPESMIFTVFPVIPPVARPYVIQDGERRDDDLTDKYNSIIKLCNKFENKTNNKRRQKELTQVEKRNVILDIQKHIWTLINNSKEKSKLSSGGKPHKSLTERMSGKDGRFRNNMTGKRVDFSARTVIGGGGVLLDVDEVGVPKYIAEELTTRCVVNNWNFDYLQNLVHEGKINKIQRRDPVTKKKNQIHLKVYPENGKYFELRKGDIAEVQLQNGDVVVLNRQPSLRIESMMSLKVKIINGYIIRLPLAVTKPFNADFDGDEMNLYLPRNHLSIAECGILMRVPLRLISPQNNSPICGIVQDGLISSYLLTNTWNESGETDTMVKKELFQNLIVNTKISQERYQDLLIRGREYYPEYINEDYSLEDEVPGKLVASILFPPNFCYRKNSKKNPKYPEIKIENGILLPDSGPMCKSSIGASGNSIHHYLWKEYSPEIATRFLTETQRLNDNWLPHHGFSMGISDCIATKRQDIHDVWTQAQAKVDSILENCEKMNAETERNINAVLNSAMNVGTKLAKENMNKGERNSLNIMRLSGAKGNVVNLTQIVAYLGQQNVSGGRIPPTLSGNSRALPHFKPHDNSANARGFVNNGYMAGLTPTEAFFHAAGGREGVISTAIKTAETGYMQNKIGRKLEDLKVHIDGTVRDVNGKIVQFYYGSDGMDAQKLYAVKGVKYPFFINPRNLANKLNSNAIRSNEVNSKTKKINIPTKIIDLILDYIKCGTNGIQSEVTRRSSENIKKDLRKLLKDVEIYECKLAVFSTEIFDSWNHSKVQDGENVGLVASASVGEPTTQLTLNVFHLAGVEGNKTTVGVPRLQEIFNGTKKEKQKTPSCKVYFSSEELEELKESNKKKECYNYLNQKKFSFEETYIKDLVSTTKMYFTFSEDDTSAFHPIKIIKYQKYKEPWWVGIYFDLNPDIGEKWESSWIVHFHFDLDKLYSKKVTLVSIVNKITSEYGEKFQCIPSPEGLGIIEVRINFTYIEEYVCNKIDFDFRSNEINTLITNKNIDFFSCKNMVIDFIKDINIGGIKDIKKVYPREEDSEWILDTEGTNLLDILSSTDESINKSRVVSDDMWSILSVLGIEACRNFLFITIKEIICSDGNYINPRHIQLLVDAMVCNGNISSVRRDGISRDVGPIAKMMFEKPIDNAVESAIFAENDQLTSVSSSVMLGKLAKVGTGCVNIKDIDRAPVETVSLDTIDTQVNTRKKIIKKERNKKIIR